MMQNISYSVDSQDKGKQVMTACKVGCIGCKMCERVCESGAVTVENNIAHIDQSKCTGCGACAAKCPKKVYLERIKVEDGEKT